MSHLKIIFYSDEKKQLFCQRSVGLRVGVGKCAVLCVGIFLSRPEKSLHILFFNPITNLHIYFNPK